jgi:steroid delta-isomerase-like uncharacterized protein
MPNNPDNEQLIRRYYEAINNRDYDAVWECFDDNLVYTDAALGHVYNDLAEFKDFYLTYMGALNVDMVLGEIVATDDAYAVSNHFQGVHNADLPGLPATGRSYSIPSASIGTIENGKIKTNTDYWNMSALLSQLGIVS